MVFSPLVKRTIMLLIVFLFIFQNVRWKDARSVTAERQISLLFSLS